MLLAIQSAILFCALAMSISTVFRGWIMITKEKGGITLEIYVTSFLWALFYLLSNI